jgi:peptidoglycan/xylan/chitin deacetylase (PgdA/CDA1 family)
MVADLRAFARDIAAGLLFLSRMTPSRNTRRFSIVTFHRVLTPGERDEYPLPALVVTPDELAWCLDFLVERFECGRLDQLHERWVADDAFEKPPLAITFDDAQSDNYRHARAVLDQKRVRATFFAPTEAVETGRLLWHDRASYAFAALARHSLALAIEQARAVGIEVELAVELLVPTFVERLKSMSADSREELIERIERRLPNPSRPSWDGLMTFEELGRLTADGHEIGSHSHTHPILTEVSDQTLGDELTRSLAVLEQRLGRKPSSLCYPNGNADERVVGAARAAGYRRAVTTRFGWNPRGFDPYLLRRFDIQSTTSRSRTGKLSRARLAFRLSGLNVNVQ